MVGSPPGPPRAGTWLLALLAAGSFGVAMDGSQFVPILSDVAQDVGTTAPQVGQVLGLGALLGTAVVLVAGPLSDRCGRRPLLLGGAALLTLGNVATAAAEGYGAFLLARLAAAVGAALLMPAAFAAVADFLPQRQAPGVGLLTGVTGLPYLVGWPLVGLAAEMVSWRGAPLAMAAGFALLVAAYAGAVPARSVPGAAGAVLRHYARLMASGQVRLGLAISVGGAAAWFGFITYVGAFLRATYQLGPAGVAPLLALLGAGYTLGGALVGWAVARWGSRRCVVAGMLSSGLLLAALLATALPFGLAAALLAGIGVGRAVGLSAFTAVYLDLTSEARGTGQALNNAIFLLGIGAGAAGGGLVVGSAGFPALGVICGALALAAGLGAAWLRPADNN